MKPDLTQQIEAFLEAVACRYAEASLLAYRAGLNRLVIYTTEAESVESMASVSEQVLGNFHAWLSLKPLSGSTVNLALRSVKLFLKWGYESGHCLWDGESYQLDQPEHKVPEPPTAEVMKRLLTLPNQRTPEGLRDLFALELLYGLGLRRAEACRLSLGDLNLNEETLFVVGKGGHQRLLPVGLHLKSVAERYLFNGRSVLLPALNETALLLDDEGHRLGRNQLYYIVKKYGDFLDLKLSTHHLRHACATHLIERGMSLTQVSQLLGHQSVDTTIRYAQISSGEMQREFQRCQVQTTAPGAVKLRYLKRCDSRTESEPPCL